MTICALIPCIPLSNMQWHTWPFTGDIFRFQDGKQVLKRIMSPKYQKGYRRALRRVVTVYGHHALDDESKPMQLLAM